MQSHFVPEIYAIDFGTTNSLLAAASATEASAPIALDELSNDPSILRSVLYFPEPQRCTCGVAAIREFVADGMQGRLIRSIKKYLPSRSFRTTLIDGRRMRLEELIGAFLKEMRVRADRYFGSTVTKVVLGRPARFAWNDDDDQCAEDRLASAARIAGFDEVRFCPEPLAAATAFSRTLDERKLVLIADFGGGTSDFTVLQLGGAEYSRSDVLAYGGLPVAGDALDSCVMRKHVARHFGAEVRYRVPPGTNLLRMPPALMEKICSPADASLLRSKEALAFLREVQAWAANEVDRQHVDQLFTLLEDHLGFAIFEAIEAGKCALSTAYETCIEFSYPTIEVREPLSRSAFELCTERPTRAMLAELDATLERACVTAASIDLVCCTGGTARVPMLARALVERFGQDKLTGFKTFHSVIEGLAEHARQSLCAN